MTWNVPNINVGLTPFPPLPGIAPGNPGIEGVVGIRDGFAVVVVGNILSKIPFASPSIFPSLVILSSSFSPTLWSPSSIGA